MLDVYLFLLLLSLSWCLYECECVCSLPCDLAEVTEGKNFMRKWRQCIV